MNSGLTFPLLYLSESRPYLSDELESRGWHVFRADSVMAALGTYVFYQPRVVILAGNSPMTREVLYHLLNVTAPSVWQVDHIFWLGDISENWEIPNFIRLHLLPATIPTYLLEMELQEVAGLVPA